MFYIIFRLVPLASAIKVSLYFSGRFAHKFNWSKNSQLRVFRLKTLRSGSKISKVVKILIIFGIQTLEFTLKKIIKILKTFDIFEPDLGFLKLNTVMYKFLDQLKQLIHLLISFECSNFASKCNKIFSF